MLCTITRNGKTIQNCFSHVRPTEGAHHCGACEKLQQLDDIQYICGPMVVTYVPMFGNEPEGVYNIIRCLCKRCDSEFGMYGTN